jgi:hypothetical protein
MNEKEQRPVFIIERPMMNAEDSKNLQIMKDIAVRNDYKSGNTWFTAEYIDAASRRNGGWSPLYGIFVIASLWAIMGSEVLAFCIFWLVIASFIFCITYVVFEKINDYISEVIFQLPHFWTVTFWLVTTWVLYHVIRFYSKV